MDAAAQLHRDEELSATAEDAATVGARALLLDTHTCLPGIIVSFNAATQTAQVQPAIRTIFMDTGAVDLPVLVDVPVQFPRGGGFVLTFPVAKGDECLLVFSERAIDFWWERGGIQLPSEYRLHDLSDAFAIMGVSSRPKMVTNFNTTATELRSLDGNTVVRLDGPNVVLNNGSAGVARVGDALKLTLSPADIVLLAQALLLTTAFTPNPSPTIPLTPPPTPLVFSIGEITSGSTTVKAGG